MNDKLERNREIVRLCVEEGLTLAVVGSRYGITRERVRQIVRDAGAPSAQTRSRERRAVQRVFWAVAVAAKRNISQAHGTRYRYSLGCSCEPCRAANREYGRSLKEKTEPPTHGLSGYLNYGCRCDVCREANNAHHRVLYAAGKRKAWGLVGRALKLGAITKPESCEGCGGPGPLHGHHEDYGKPLDVDWLCAACHGERHAPTRRRRRRVAA